MPGGNPTIKHEPLDLGSFLERKRKPLKVWLTQNNITSEQALQNFLNNPEWSISEKLIETIRGFFFIAFKPEEQSNISIYKFETLPPPPFASVVEVIVEETQQEIVQEVVVVPPPEEIVPTVEEEETADARSAISNRERKKNR